MGHGILVKGTVAFYSLTNQPYAQDDLPKILFTLFKFKMPTETVLERYTFFADLYVFVFSATRISFLHAHWSHFKFLQKSLKYSVSSG